jgi:mono/diheme cytochrome c family protein
MKIPALPQILAAAAVGMLLCLLLTPGAEAQLIRQPNSTLNLSETSPPATLSATGAFANLATLTPNQGIVPFAPNVPFWSDYAQKLRWFCLPDLASKITFSADSNWTFPTGMVWVKHFNLPNERTNPTGPSRRIETRFIVKTGEGIYGLTYAWRNDQADADLVPDYGMDTFYDVTVNGKPTQQLWHYPARYECIECHSPAGGYGLGFNTRQMNGSHVYGTQNLNQIKALSDAGYFAAPVSHVNNLPALAKASDTTQSLEWRVRSYFAANCLQCHQPGGEAYTYWDARPTTPTDFANIIRGMLVFDADDPANRFIVPGDTSHSMVLQRLTGEEPRMPPIATREIDPEAIQLITDWITRDLPTRLSFREWQIYYFRSSTVPEADPVADPDLDGQNNMSEFLANTNPIESSSRLDPLRGSTNGAQAEFTFTQPANRAALVQTSTDLINWSLWDVPGNLPSYPPAAVARIITTPSNAEDGRFFRLQLSAP